MLPVQLTEEFHETERCNVLLTGTEEFRLNAWIRLRDDVRLEITYRPENYPSLELRVVTVSDKKLAEHIQKTCVGMLVRKLNPDIYPNIRRDEDGRIVEPDDG